MADNELSQAHSTTPHVRVTHGARSDVGCRRKLNEDSYIARFPLYLVADGMGGHSGGNIASAEVIAQMGAHIGSEDFVTQEELNHALMETTRALSELGMNEGSPGSTMSGLVFSTHSGIPCIRIFNIGDSRTYALAENEFSQVTVDHSEFQELKDSGALSEKDARDYLHRNVLTKALGAGFSPSIPIDHFVAPIADGDRYIICSDGVSGEVTDALIEMAARNIADPQDLADELINMALRAGGNDNATVIVVDAHDVHPLWQARGAGDTIRRDDARHQIDEKQADGQDIQESHNAPEVDDADDGDDTLPGERVIHLRALAEYASQFQGSNTPEEEEL
ncbi:PP2C family protein-serine/threonine phosphatase [Schaalia canis]|uniref:Serine/threonine-protein phosphatase n=1 Tax=Schaalia canis TaxID=100469 RepID=A0A3P1SEB9_9ACTO|nr:protein phosphatase 2C domain-containing protein [Schaalia canis]RRC95359.1 serine/threonine-protein phosphatase [Schaalia canis]